MTDKQLDRILNELFVGIPTETAQIFAVLLNDFFHRLMDVDEGITIKGLHEQILNLEKKEREKEKINEHLN